MHIVIIGAGIAGVSAAFSLRQKGFDGKLTLVDGDSDLPYDRPPLSKDFLKDISSEADILLQGKGSYKDNNIDLLLGVTVTDIDPVEKSITLSTEETVQWDKLLITTGSKLKRLQEAENYNNVFYLKTRQDALRMKEALQSIQHLVVIGAGFIGMEAAASFISLGKKVTILEAALTPLARVLGEDMGNYIADVHRKNGVEIITNSYVSKFIGREKIEAVETNDGKRIPCDAVLIGIGVCPDSSLVESKLEFNNGIMVNEFCETSAPDIYAAGDCARWPYSVNGQFIRVEHWDHSVNHGKTAASNMLNPKSASYNNIPYFWSNQYDLALQYVGHPTDWDQTVLRGSMENQEFTKFYLYKNKVVGALIVNQPMNVLSVRKLILNSIMIDEEKLSDESIKLKDFTKKQKV